MCKVDVYKHPTIFLFGGGWLRCHYEPSSDAPPVKKGAFVFNNLEEATWNNSRQNSAHPFSLMRLCCTSRRAKGRSTPLAWSPWCLQSRVDQTRVRNLEGFRAMSRPVLWRNIHLVLGHLMEFTFAAVWYGFNITGPCWSDLWRGHAVVHSRPQTVPCFTAQIDSRSAASVVNRMAKMVGFLAPSFRVTSGAGLHNGGPPLCRAPGRLHLTICLFVANVFPRSGGSSQGRRGPSACATNFGVNLWT